MDNETKTCQNCSKDFAITTEDFEYYKKIDVPAPTFCPSCRAARRISCVNGWSLFWRNCDKCEQKMLSIYPPEQEITVFCSRCWWADDWDGTEYAMDYDPNRPFFEQLKELSEKTPFASVETEFLTLKDCDYCNALAFCKNCFLIIWADYCENAAYSSILNKLKESADCLRMNDCELCYEAIGQHKAYRVFYSQECDSCNDVWFSRNCYNCTNCIGCVNLRGASYKIFNEQYTKEEYEKKVEEMQLNTRSGIKALAQQAEEFWQKFPYRAYSGNTLNYNVTGEYVYESKNAQYVYLGTNVEDSKYVQFVSVPSAKGCMDYSGWGNGAELVYDSHNIGNNVSNVKFSSHCFPDVLNLEYCLWVISGKNNFGCVNLKRKQYAILNKVYDKETYEKLVAEIKEKMKNEVYTDQVGREYRYGEFFLPAFSKFAYNNSNASKFFPKTKEEVEAMGYKWREEDDQEVEATLQASELPETINEVDDGILQEVIQCSECPRKYRIVSIEYGLLQKMNIPLPDACPKCREAKRFSKINLPEFHERNCAKCNAEVTTAFAPDRPEIIYCDSCYQQEMQ